MVKCEESHRLHILQGWICCEYKLIIKEYFKWWPKIDPSGIPATSLHSCCLFYSVFQKFLQSCGHVRKNLVFQLINHGSFYQNVRSINMAYILLPVLFFFIFRVLPFLVGCGGCYGFMNTCYVLGNLLCLMLFRYE